MARRCVFRVAATAAIAIAGAGCFGGAYDVMRVHEGRARAERFVSEAAYAASLEASIAEARGDWSRAAAALRKAIDEDPGARDLEARLARAECELGDRDTAMRTFADAIDAEPTLERAYTDRARCRLLAHDARGARDDLLRALAADAAAVEPALDLAELDLAAGAVEAARRRVEELLAIHPTEARAWRIATSCHVAEGDARRATAAALATARVDHHEGAAALAKARELVDRSGVAQYALAIRGVRAPSTNASPPTCAPLLDALERLASTASANELMTAADGVIAACAEGESAVTEIVARATWSPASAEAIEMRASSSSSSAVRRWGARARLRRLDVEAIVAAAKDGALPRAEDRPTVAIAIASEALLRSSSDVRAAMALAESARAMAIEEPTVARLVAEVARRAGTPAGDPMRTTACALAQTTIERRDCARP